MCQDYVFLHKCEMGISDPIWHVADQMKMLWAYVNIATQQEPISREERWW